MHNISSVEGMLWLQNFTQRLISIAQEKWLVILLTKTLFQWIMMLWQIMQNPLGFIKIFNFDVISKIFTGIIKVIFLYTKSEIIIVSIPSGKLSLNIVQV